jgi:hypothetical protein
MEEIDYLGIFGGIVGRVNGVYVGAPHDLVHLAVKGHVGPGLAVILVSVAVAVGLVLWKTGILQPRRLADTFLHRRGLWVLGGAILFGLAQLEDTGLLLLLGPPNIEELLELAGSLLWLAFALEVASDAFESAAPPELDAAPARVPDARKPRRVASKAR